MIKLKLEPEAMWIYGSDEVFDPSELGEFTKEERSQIKFLVFPMTPELLRGLREKHKKPKQFDLTLDNPLTAEENIDDIAFQKDVLESIVKDWDGFADEAGERIPCTLENKLKVFNRGYPRIGFCLMKAARSLMAKYDTYIKKAKEIEVKNLQSSQSG